MSKTWARSALYLDTDPNWSNETLSLTLALSYLDLKSFERDMLNNFEHVEDRIYCIWSYFSTNSTFENPL